MSEKLLRVIIENMINEIIDDEMKYDEDVMLITLESRLNLNYQYLDDDLMNELVRIVREIL